MRSAWRARLNRGQGFGLRLSARGSAQPDRLPTDRKGGRFIYGFSEAVNGGSIGLTERVELFKALRTIIQEEHGL